MKKTKKNTPAKPFKTKGGILVRMATVDNFVEGELLDPSTKKVVGKGRWTEDGFALFGTQFSNAKKTLAALARKHDYFDINFTTVFNKQQLKK